MTDLRLIFADQLDHELTALDGIAKTDTVLMVEVRGETDHSPHHRKKIAFLFSAMRHFAAELEERGIKVDYVCLDDPDNTQSFATEIERARSRVGAERVIMTEPGEYRVEDNLAERVDEVRPDRRFLCSRSDFAQWADGRKAFRMENFYRWMRTRSGYLMDGDEPVGGKWNYDAENRKPPKSGLSFKGPARFKPDRITQEVLALVGREFEDRFGDLEPFWFAVDAKQARQALAHFIEHSLPSFGDYQDAMLDGEDYLFHSALSQYLNCGLLRPAEIIEAAIQALDAGDAPLNAVEGFVRQILGWREYVRGLYWHFMPDYARMNELDADRKLPDFYWTGETDMRCMAHVIDQTRREAHSHHIQRLMVTGNFALLVGVLPEQLCDWYLAVYADAYEWVEMPNTLGMVAYADGGLMGSKPYAASGAYINRMSNFCGNCRYKVKLKSGPDACPFNYLYWDFLMRHQKRFKQNRRMGPIMGNIDRMSDERRQEIRSDTKRFMKSIGLD